MGEVDDFVLRAVDDEDGGGDARNLVDAGEGVEEPRALGLREGHTHAGHEGRVEDDGAHLVPRGQVYRGHRADALSIQDDVL